ncbi:ABC transporter substrate-binding protein [Shinella sp. CPCC 101442]|uniref:ABC transporter substrate-binding protein n=1 Tax=Shinella sp. CPCC 101442 TaxID=2932265 RepID=UPI0021538DB8|nr:ABC transporter substrate-binding protein [Shinella sp. CPCC 101442]MCR6497421.1 ABC transporter substrate-binding protein [Shinella sp. CPCC 101442]
MTDLKSLVLAGGIIAAGMACATPVSADVLKDIKDRGNFICGTLGTSEPFSFQDATTRAVVGYEIDLCQAIADSLGVPLELKLISVEARIPELVAGRVDLVAANLGWNPERAQQIDYSNQHFVSMQKVLVRADAGLKSSDELAGKRVSAVRGSSSERGAREHIKDVNVLTFKDGGSAFLAVQQGKVSGMVSSEMAHIKLRDAAKKDGGVEVMILEPALFAEPWGLGLRKGEDAFKAHVNKVLADLETSGKFDQIFDKWFGVETSFGGLKRAFKIEEITE